MRTLDMNYNTRSLSYSIGEGWDMQRNYRNR